MVRVYSVLCQIAVWVLWVLWRCKLWDVEIIVCVNIILCVYNMSCQVIVWMYSLSKKIIVLVYNVSEPYIVLCDCAYFCVSVHIIVQCDCTDYCVSVQCEWTDYCGSVQIIVGVYLQIQRLSKSTEKKRWVDWNNIYVCVSWIFTDQGNWFSNIQLYLHHHSYSSCFRA